MPKGDRLLTATYADDIAVLLRNKRLASGMSKYFTSFDQPPATASTVET